MKAHTAVNLLTGLVVTCTYCSLPAPFVQQRTLTYQVPEQNEALGLLVIWHLKSVTFIRLTLKPKHTQCFSNICLQRIFCLNSILPLSGVSNPATGCIFYRNGLIHHRDETPPPRQTIQLKISTRSVFFFFWGGGTETPSWWMLSKCTIWRGVTLSYKQPLWQQVCKRTWAEAEVDTVKSIGKENLSGLMWDGSG